MYNDAALRTTEISPPMARWWLLSGVLALALGGVYAIVLVVARTPALASLTLFADLFHTALVAHVNLSVLVWFLAVACMCWSVEARARPVMVIPYLEGAALLSFNAGSVAIALSPMAGGEALMSNYVPVNFTPVFFLGLALLLAGVFLQVVHYSLRANAEAGGSVAALALRLGASTGAIMAMLAVGCFVWAYRLMPGVIEGQQYYDMLFWAGGHVLQFLNTQFLLVAWLLLAAAVSPGFVPSGKAVLAALMIGFVVVLASPIAFFMFDIASMPFRQFFTHQMMALGVAPLIIGAMAVMALRGEKAEGVRGARSALVMSLLLFVYGGVLALMIREQNVTIPAHYHGSIVGVTLAFMGLAYIWLPRFGYKEVAGTRLAFWQPIVLGIGQVLHVSGLAWSGGYGVLRKTPGALEGGFSAAKAAMGLMGLGGMLAIIGGLMFVIAVIRSVMQR